VVEVGTVTMLQAGRDRFEDEAVQAHRVPASAERQPVEINRRHRA
jgi:hypothetical protein